MELNTADCREHLRATWSWRAAGPVLLLCLVAGSRWLFDEALPAARFTSLSAAAGCAMAAFVVLLWGWMRKLPGPAGWLYVPRSMRWKVPLGAALTLASPALSSALADRHVNAEAATLALTLTPVVVAVAGAASVAGGEMTGLLWPGLAGVAGLLLLLPEPSLASWRMDAALAAMPLITGTAGTFVADHSRTVGEMGKSTAEPRSRWIELGLLLAMILFGLLALRAMHGGEEQVFSWSGSLADASLWLLTLWTLWQAGAVRWSAQFLLTPLVTLLEAIALLRPALTARSWVGLVLLALGGVYLLMQRVQDTPKSLT